MAPIVVIIIVRMIVIMNKKIEIKTQSANVVTTYRLLI